MDKNNQEIKSFDEVLKDLKPAEIAGHPVVRDKFTDILMKIHKLPAHEAASVYEREMNYFVRAINESAYSGSGRLHTCTSLSLFNTFLEIAILGLSIQPGGKAEAFLEPRSSKMKYKGKDGKEVEQWITTARLVVMTHGELNLRLRAGQIVRMANPQVIYDGDVFQPRTNDKGDLTVDYRPQIPRKQGAKIVGCYVCLVLPNDQRDFKWLLHEDIERLKNYSKPKTGQNQQANALYTAGPDNQIDPGFLETKTIKHAMRTLTKLKVSGNVEFEGDGFEQQDQQDHKAANNGGATNTNVNPDMPEAPPENDIDENSPF